MSERCAGCESDDGAPAMPATTAVWNRPGLPALSCRIGTYSSFLDAMKRRVGQFVPEGVGKIPPPLRGLDVAAPGDPAIGLLDAWATIADIVTFYQERIANEGYLRTATELASVQALAATVGYALKPGVAASVLLAYDVKDPGGGADVTIPAATKVQSTPVPGGQAQSYETSSTLQARAAWSRLAVRTSQASKAPTPVDDTIWLAGVATGVAPGDRLLFLKDGQLALPFPRHVHAVEVDFAGSRTKVALESVLAPPPPALRAALPAPATADAAAPPVGLAQAMTPGSDAKRRLLGALDPSRHSQWQAAALIEAALPAPKLEVIAFRTRAALFGNNAPLKPVLDREGKVIGQAEWTLSRTVGAATESEDFVIVFDQLRKDAGGRFEARVRTRIGSNEDIAHVVTAGDPKLVYEDRPAGETVTVTFEFGKVITLAASFERRDFGVVIDDVNGIDIRTHGGDPVNVLLDVEQGSGTESDSTGAARAAGGTDRGALAQALTALRLDTQGGGTTGGGATSSVIITIRGQVRAPTGDTRPTEEATKLSLDAAYDKIVPRSWCIVERPLADGSLTIVSTVKSAQQASRADYGLAARTTQVVLDRPWIGPDADPPGQGVPITREDFALAIRGTTVWAQSESLALAPRPVLEPVTGAVLVLDGYCPDLQPGRLLIVEGEQLDDKGTSLGRGAERVVLAAATHAIDPPGDPLRTRLALQAPLANRYVPDSLVVHANVVDASQGESRSEVLGSGDAGRPSQPLPIHQGPLTYVSSASAGGLQSTLRVRVNDVLWHEAASLAGAGSTDRVYVTQRLDGGRVAVVFGNGVQGARPPTGSGNIRAVYRTGMGSAGNVAAHAVNQAVSRPAGVSAVDNPIAGGGGADAETADSARANAPRAAMALDRLVSTSDYADFARAFAGIGKAAAARLSSSGRVTVCVTVAGVEEAPLPAASDAVRNLALAARELGDPHEPVLVLPAEAVLLQLSARVRVLPDYEWFAVAPAVRAALLGRFGFARRDFGQDLVLSDVVGTIQRVPGVDYVDVDTWQAHTAASVAAGVPPRAAERIRALPARLGARTGGVRPVLPAQVAYLAQGLPELLTLTEITR